MTLSGDLLTTRQVADRCGVLPQTVAKWVRAGKLEPAVKGDGIRGAMFFRADDVERLPAADAEEGAA